MPRVCGLCGSSGVSTLAWCLRWIATHSLVTMPVVSHSQKRKKWLIAGMEVERAMRLRAVQEDRHAGDRDVRESPARRRNSPTMEAASIHARQTEQIEGHQAILYGGRVPWHRARLL